MTSRFIFPQFRPAARRKWKLAFCMILSALGASASQEGPQITTFDAPGAGTFTAPCLAQGTFPYGINEAGAIGGNFQDANNVLHGLLRTPEGAGTGSGQGSWATSINAEGMIAGFCLDANNVAHGFLRTPDGTTTTVDVPGAQLTSLCAVDCINPEGLIAGVYADASNVLHGFLRAPDGTITKFDVPGAGVGSGQGTFPGGINPEGLIAGVYADASNVNHGFLREPDGTISKFDVPSAGSGSGQGTLPSGFLGINSEAAITGNYLDANNVSHGFLRSKRGAITTFDASGVGTFPLGALCINREGAITGYYIDASNVGHGFLRTGDRCHENCQEE